jgi:Ca-activated chloride channel family protein
MVLRRLAIVFLFIVLVCGGVIWLAAQESQLDDRNVVRVVVEMVQLNVAVTDNKGNYVTGLKPSDFTIIEDKIPQKLASFEEGNQGQQILDPSLVESQQKAGEAQPVTPATTPASSAAPPARAATGSSTTPGASLAGLPQKGIVSGTPLQIRTAVSGASVYILFDKSNYMYRGFVFAQDAIADFVRSLDLTDRVAFYSYSRDITRDAVLTSDRDEV